MKRLAALVFAAGVAIVAAGHIGSPNVVFDGLAGPYAVRVVVRPPEVVPGLAEVVVRAAAPDVQRVSIRPVFWRAGVKGAPTGDVLPRVAGQANVYSGQLWLMAYGAYSVYVTVDGPRGSGTVIVPVSSFATGRLPVPAELGAILVALGVLLVAGLLTLIHAGAGESLVAPGEAPSPAVRRRAWRITAIAAPLLAFAVFGGATWWNAEDSAYRGHLFGSPRADAAFTVDAAHRTLRLTVRDTASFRAIYAPVVPDHGKMLHLFLISTNGAQTMAHLHPVQTDSLVFTTEVPWIPAGRYLLFGDLALENGLSLSVTNRIDVPVAPGAVTPSDTDDTWDRTPAVTTLAPDVTRALSGGAYAMTWTGGETPLQSGTPVDLRFSVRDSSGSVVPVRPYLGMAAHAIIVGHDGSVFIHLHPMGTFPMVAQQVFALRDRGDTTAAGRLVTESLTAPDMAAMRMSGDISFPYEFPKPGRYRLWVQVKPADRVLTGTFDVDVR
ncbi:MAG: hypothetical protein ACREPM_15510 [Gemmatimonadaceae bacterium]